MSPRFFSNLAFTLVATAVALTLRAETALLNVYARPGLSLNGKWNVIIDPYETGYYDYRQQPLDLSPNDTRGYYLDRQSHDKSDLIEYNFDQSPTLTVPGDWNSQQEKLLYYEGTIWYRRLFDYHPTAGDARLHLYFGAANYAADVYLNGKLLGRHIGGFTPFSFEVTGRLKATGNSLVVRVNNTRHLDAVPTVNTDWWNYGGITRDVLLVETPATFIRDYHVQLKKGARDRIAATVRLDRRRAQASPLAPGNGAATSANQTVAKDAGAPAAASPAPTNPPERVTITIPEANITATATADANGVAQFEIPAPKLDLWSPAHPRLYSVEIACDGDHIADRIGFRTIETRGTDILLNGQAIFLRGVCLHEEDPLRGGRVTTEGEARMLLGWAKELNCNFLRLAHYPHNEYMARVADELGLMLWEEVPVYWTIQFENPDTLKNAQAQLTDLIVRDRNRASVIVWSVANETPVNEPRTRFLKNLVDLARSLDDARLVSAAMEVTTDPADDNHKIVDDPFGAYTDLLSFNEYVGWYVGLPDKLQKIRWTLKYEKPVVISEFGAGALQGFHGDKLTRFSEEFQEDVYRQTLAMLQKIPAWRGATPWILCDFRSPRRPLAHMQDGWNRKGLIGENGTKKKAFYVLKEFYDQKATASGGDAP
jgi:beta-glucuronidase